MHGGRDNYVIKVIDSHGPNIWIYPYNRDFVIEIPKQGEDFFDRDTITVILVHEIALDKLGFIDRRKNYDDFFSWIQKEEGDWALDL
jgi:hypothetical protein